MAENKDFNYKMQFAGIDKLSNPLSKMQKSLAITSQELRSLRKVEKHFGQFKALKQNTIANANALKTASREAAVLGREFHKTENPTKKMAAEFKRAQMRVQGLKVAQGKEIQELAKLGKSLKKAGYNTSNLSESQKRLKTTIGKTNQSLDKQRTQLKKAGAEMRRQNAAQDKYRQSLSTSSNLAVVGASGVAVGTRSLKGMFSMISSVRTLAKAQGDLKKMGLNAGDIQNLAPDFSKVADKWAYITDEDLFASHYTTVSTFGAKLSNEAMASVTQNAAIMGIALNANTSEMTNLIATSYGSFKDYMPDISNDEFFDQIYGVSAKAVQYFKTTGVEMNAAIKGVGGEAIARGVSLEEQFAILGMLQSSGLSGSESATAFRSFSANAAKADDYFVKQGINIRFLDEHNKIRTLPDILKNIKEEFGDDLDAQELKLIKQGLGTDEGAKILTNLFPKMSDLAKSIGAMGEGLNEGMDGVLRMAEAGQKDNPDTEIQAAMEDLATMKRKLGKAFLPILQDILPALKSATTWVGNFVESHKTLVKNIGIGIVIFGTLITVMGALTLAIAAILGPFAALRLTKVLLSAKALGLTKNNKSLGTSFMRLSKKYIPKAGAAIKSFGSDLYSLARNKLASTWVGIKMVGMSLLDLAKKSILAAGRGAKWLGRSFVTLAHKSIAILMTGLRGVGRAFIWVGTRAILPLLAGIRAVTLAILMNPIGLAITAIAIGAVLLIKYWKPIKKFFGKVFTAMRAPALATWNLFKKLFRWSPIGMVKENWDALPNVFRAVFTLIQSIAKSAMDKVTALITAPLRMIKGLKDKLKGIPQAIRRKSKLAKHSAKPALHRGLKATAGLGIIGMGIANPAFAQMSQGEPITGRSTAQRPAAQAQQPIQININAAPGMDETALARLVADKFAEIQRAQARQNSNSLHDIED